jgi:hypothetical protein
MFMSAAGQAYLAPLWRIAEGSDAGRRPMGYAQSMGIEPDASESLDLVTVFSSGEHGAEMEAITVQGLLEAGGIPAVLVGSAVIPALPFEVRVPRERLEEAEALLRESESIGYRGAEEAEEASEEPK